MYANTVKSVNRYNPGQKGQRLATRFDFVGKGVSQPSLGVVQYKLMVDSQSYGPYRTTITCTKANWEARKQRLVPVRGQRIQQQIIGLQGRLLVGWAALDPFGQEPITGAMILSKAGLVISQTGEGFVYVH